MTGTKICKKCGKNNLGWDYEFNKKSGKWKLENHKRMDGKWCNKVKEEFNKVKTSKNDFEKCKLCLGNSGFLLKESSQEKFPSIPYESMSKHISRFHPLGQKLDDIDMMAITVEQKKKIREERKH